MLKRLPVFYALFCLTSIRKMTCAEGSTNNKSGRIHGNHIAWLEVPAGGGWQRVWDLKFWREKNWRHMGAHMQIEGGSWEAHANMAISKQSLAFSASIP